MSTHIYCYGKHACYVIVFANSDDVKEMNSYKNSKYLVCDCLFSDKWEKCFYVLFSINTGGMGIEVWSH